MADTPNANLAARLQEQLGLELSPVAVARVQEQPAGIPRSEEASPSTCTFWRRAESQVFYAAAEDHFHCPIGAMVMGFDLPVEKMQELMGLVQEMCSINYLSPDEVAHIPKFTEKATGIVYGPLARFPLEPDVVLVWATPMQAMLLQETAGLAQWSATPQGAVFGRPACGVLPTALGRGKTTISLGCIGMRTNTDIPAQLCLVAVPGSKLGRLGTALEPTVAANQQMMETTAKSKRAISLYS